MAIPLKVSGAGNTSTARNCYKLTFSTANSVAPLYKCWDNSQTFPVRDASGATTAHEIFTGTTGNSLKPMLSLVDTSSAAPASSWKPASATGGTANPNRMKGSASYVTATVTPGAAGYITWNMCLEAPYDATVPSTTSMAALLEITYYYTGAVPSLTWSANEGTEATPTWTTLTPGTHGMRFCNSTATVGDSATWKLTLPSSSTVDDGAQLVTV